MTALIINTTVNSASFVITQLDNVKIFFVENICVSNPVTNPFTTSPSTVYIRIPQLEDYRTTMFEPGNRNYGQVHGHANLHSGNIYRSPPTLPHPFFIDHLGAQTLTVNLLDEAGNPLVFNVGTSCSLKLSFRQ